MRAFGRGHRVLDRGAAATSVALPEAAPRASIPEPAFDACFEAAAQEVLGSNRKPRSGPSGCLYGDVGDHLMEGNNSGLGPRPGCPLIARLNAVIPRLSFTHLPVNHVLDFGVIPWPVVGFPMGYDGMLEIAIGALFNLGLCLVVDDPPAGGGFDVDVANLIH